ncbi:FUN14 family [Lotmaria passim]
MCCSPEEIEKLEAAMATHNLVPMDTLRQTFFDDLDASSRVNPNRSRISIQKMSSDEERRMFQALRAETFSRFGEEQLPDEPEADGTGSRQHLVDSPRVTSQRRREASQMRRSTGRMSASFYETGQGSGDDLPFARASCAVLANLVAGSLLGIALKRITSVAAANLSAILIGTQLLCWTGYATVHWSALLNDTISLILRGYHPSVEEPHGRLAQKREQLLVTLTATIPRRASFWGGVAIGVICLH